jgi:effector-binding domain-containing protein
VRGRVAPEDLGALIGIAHAQEFEPDQIDVEIGFVLQGDSGAKGLPPVPGLKARVLPAVAHMATCVRIGPPEQAHLVTAKIGQFVEASGYQLAGPSREVFLQPPKLDRMHESVVEMQFPVEQQPATSAFGKRR